LYNGAVPVFDEAIQEIKTIADQQAFQQAKSRGGLVKKSYNASYVGMLSTLFAHLRGCSMPIVFDCGNAATGPILQALIKQLDWQDTYVMHAEVDGRYPNHLADPVDERNMQDVAAALQRGSFLCGIGFDGDGDRMGVMMNDGHLMSGDKLTGLFGQSIVHHAPQSDVVVDVKCSPIVIDFLHDLSARCHMSATGHAFVRHKLHRIHAVLGGELSCHFFFRDRYFGFDDGMYAALRWCELLMKSEISVAELVAQFPSSYASPELRIACPEAKKHHVVDVLAEIYNARTDASCTSVDGVRFVLPYGWAIIRVSNTQPAISVRFESMTSSGFNRLESELYKNLVSHIDTAVLDEHFC
jgi:phosphomannomutase